MSRRSADRHEFGIAGPAFGHWTFDDLLDLMDELGFYKLDCSYKHISILGAERMRRLLDERGMKALVVSVSPYLGRIGEADGEHRGTQALLTAITDAQALGADVVQFHTATPSNDNVAATHELIMEDLVGPIEAAKAAGLTLVLENNFDNHGEDAHERNPARRPESISALLECAGHDALGITFDACNFYLSGTEAFPHGWRLLQDSVVTVHMKDATRYDERLYGPRESLAGIYEDSVTGTYLPVPVGLGALPWSQLMAAIRETRPGANLLFEATTSDGDQRRWLKQSLAFLRSL